MKRLYVPLPDKSGRRQLMNILLKTSPSSLTAEDVEGIVDSTEGKRRAGSLLPQVQYLRRTDWLVDGWLSLLSLTAF